MFRLPAWVAGLAIGVVSIFLTASLWVVRADTYVITISTTGFIPATLQAAVGDQITFLNSTTATHSAVTTDPNGFNTGDIGPGQSRMITLENTGTFEYSSAYDSSFTGSVVVATGAATITSPSPTAVPLTQEQPVSGTFEIVMAIVAAGLGLLGFGWFSARRTRETTANPVVNLPLISAEDTGHDNKHS